MNERIIDDLKPCPNPECTHEIKPVVIYYDDCWVFCESCGLTGPSGSCSEKLAIKLWNNLPRQEDMNAKIQSAEELAHQLYSAAAFCSTHFIVPQMWAALEDWEKIK
jgi:hypothetical protein